MTSEFRRYAKEMRQIIPGQTKEAAQGTAILASALAPSDKKNQTQDKLNKNFVVTQTRQGVYKIQFRRAWTSARYGRFDIAFWTHEALNPREEENRFSYTPTQPRAARTPFTALRRRGTRADPIPVDTRERGRKYLERAAARGAERYRILVSEALQHLFDSSGVSIGLIDTRRRVGIAGDLPDELAQVHEQGREDRPF